MKMLRFEKTVRTSVIALFLFFVAVNAFCEDWKFTVIKDSPYYNLRIFYVRGGVVLQDPDGVLNVGEIVFSTDNVFRGGEPIEGGSIVFFELTKDGDIRSDVFYAYAENLVPTDTEEFFREETLEKTFLDSFTIDVLNSGDRETLFRHMPSLLENSSLTRFWEIRDELYFPIRDALTIRNSFLEHGARHYLVINRITRTELGYRVVSRKREHAPRDSDTVAWDIVPHNRAFDLLMHFDGDFLDLYVNSTENRLGTFVSVCEEFVLQLTKLMQTNTVDLSRVRWPRRSDGSTDFITPREPATTAETEFSEDCASSHGARKRQGL